MTDEDHCYTRRSQSPLYSDFSASILAAQEEVSYAPTSPAYTPKGEDTPQKIYRLQQELEILKEKYKRHTTCIEELQKVVFKKRQREESPVLAVKKQKEEPFDIQQLHQLKELLQTHRSVPLDTKELRIKTAIGQFLRSWNKSYRCGHYMRDQCKYQDSDCYHIHSKANHSDIARELRVVLQQNGSTSNSAFFGEIIANVERRDYQYSDVLQTLRQELVTLSRTLQN
jgi:hypothetical protein